MNLSCRTGLSWNQLALQDNAVPLQLSMVLKDHTRKPGLGQSNATTRVSPTHSLSVPCVEWPHTTWFQLGHRVTVNTILKVKLCYLPLFASFPSTQHVYLFALLHFFARIIQTYFHYFTSNVICPPHSYPLVGVATHTLGNPDPWLQFLFWSEFCVFPLLLTSWTYMFFWRRL